jgi:ubiquinone/menaquinone biosynthesis C-methylase UbiE
LRLGEHGRVSNLSAGRFVPMSGSQQLTVAEANRRLYAQIAERYDSSEDCVVDPRLRERLRDALAQAVALLSDGARVLDACGGSGNASLMLSEMGLSPLTVDLSPEMLAIYERKARAAGYAPRTEVAEIESFLRTGDEPFDMVVFSSALHHMDDYASVVELALDRLAPGGVLVTMFDPSPAGPVARRFGRIDYVLHVLVHSPRRVPRLVASRLGRHRHDHVPPAAAGPEVGALAERHAATGVDDADLVRRIVARGGRVLAHPRYTEARFALTRALLRLFRVKNSFSLIARLPD